MRSNWLTDETAASPVSNLGKVMRALLLAAGFTVSACAAHGSTLETGYIGDYFRNVDGGIRQDDAYLQNISLTFESQIPPILSSGSARMFAYALYNDDTMFSPPNVGDAQFVSNIDAPGALRLYELWYEQDIGPLSARFGLYDLNSEFDVIETATLFLNGSHGIGADIGLTGVNGPSIFPATSLALRVQWSLSEATGLRYAVMDGIPGDPNDLDRTTIDLSSDDGALQILELTTRWRDSLQVTAGYWRYSADFDYVNRFDAMGNNLRGDGNQGWYLSADGQLFATDASRAVNAFIRYGQANDAFNNFGDYLGAGFVINSPFGENDGQLGFAIASAGTSNQLRQLVPGTPDRETSLELTYSFQVTPWLRLQPDMQFVINPGASPTLGDAWVLGLRVEIGGSWELGR
jgi:porin